MCRTRTTIRGSDSVRVDTDAGVGAMSIHRLPRSTCGEKKRRPVAHAVRHGARTYTCLPTVLFGCLPRRATAVATGVHGNLRAAARCAANKNCTRD
jgi:hypothetical protein